VVVSNNKNNVNWTCCCLEGSEQCCISCRCRTTPYCYGSIFITFSLTISMPLYSAEFVMHFYLRSLSLPIAGRKLNSTCFILLCLLL